LMCYRAADVALVLAGGRGRRFGFDKLSIRVDGGTLLERVVRLANRIACRVYLSIVDPTRHATVSARWLVDLEQLPCSGPARSLATFSLVSLDQWRVAIVPGDALFLKPELYSRLLSLLDVFEAQAATVLHDVWVEPLITVYVGSLFRHALRACGLRRWLSRASDMLRLAEPLLLVGVGIAASDPHEIVTLNRVSDLVWPKAPKRDNRIILLEGHANLFLEALDRLEANDAIGAAKAYLLEAKAYRDHGVAHLEAQALIDACKLAREALDHEHLKRLATLSGSLGGKIGGEARKCLGGHVEQSRG